MRMDGVTRCRPEHDVKLLIHGPLLLCFFHIQSAVFTSSSWSTWSATFTSARICVPLSCCLAARTCSKRSFCVMTKELTTSAISAMTSWRDMLPLRGSVVPLKLLVWVNHDTYFQYNLNATLTSARYCMLTVVSFATRPSSKRPWAHDGGTCSRELRRRWRSRRLRYRTGDVEKCWKYSHPWHWDYDPCGRGAVVDERQCRVVKRGTNMVPEIIVRMTRNSRSWLHSRWSSGSMPHKSERILYVFVCDVHIREKLYVNVLSQATPTYSKWFYDTIW